MGKSNSSYADSVNSDPDAVVFKERKRWLFLGLPFTFTVYRIKRDDLSFKRGLFSTDEEHCYMYKIQDVTEKRSFLERLVGIGTVVCHTGDTTNPIMTLKHIKNCSKVCEYILKESEEARLRRRTVNTLDVGAEVDTDADLS